MSRYTAEQPDGSVISYGYDNPLQEYFVQKHSKKGKVIFAISSHTTLTLHPDYPGQLDFSNGDIADILYSYEGIDENHLVSIALDLPF